MMQGKAAFGRSDIKGKSKGMRERGYWIERMHEKEKRKGKEYKGKKRNNSKKTLSYICLSPRSCQRMVG